MPITGHNTFAQSLPTRALTIMTIMLIPGTATDIIRACISAIPDSTDQGFEADTVEDSVKAVEDSAANRELRTLIRVRSPAAGWHYRFAAFSELLCGAFFCKTATR